MSRHGLGPGAVGNLHRVSRRARATQLVPWVIGMVEADGGRATFVGFGRTEQRLLQTIVGGLPTRYVADLVRFESDSPASRRRHRLREIRLYVQRADLAGSRSVIYGPPSQVELAAEYGRDLEAEKGRLRRLGVDFPQVDHPHRAPDDESGPPGLDSA